MDNEDEAAAVNVLVEAMGAPIMNIADNAGVLGALVREKERRGNPPHAAPRPAAALRLLGRCVCAGGSIAPRRSARLASPVGFAARRQQTHPPVPPLLANPLRHARLHRLPTMSGATASTPRRSSTRTCSTPASPTLPRSPRGRSRMRPRSAALCSPQSASLPTPSATRARTPTLSRISPPAWAKTSINTLGDRGAGRFRCRLYIARECAGAGA